ncbi:MAG: hypothetical protein R3B45_00100 [Bdellovibrionota bacterium]
MKKRSRVLSDYKKVGKKFIPPFIHMLGPMKNVSYHRSGIPEIIWMGLLNERFGIARGAEIAAKFAENAKELDAENRWAAPMTAIHDAFVNQSKELISGLDKKGILQDLRDGLHDFTVCYPENPLKIIFETQPSTLKDERYLSQYKEVFSSFFEKRGRPAIMMQANAIYMAFIQDKLKVNKGLALADFPEIEKYPNTEKSKQVGASICAALNMMFAHQVGTTHEGWKSYFWNQGFILEPLQIQKVWEDYEENFQ